MGHVIDIRRFGGLRHLMPNTHATFLVGCLALAGVVPFAGFWSKDAIVAAVEEKSHDLSHPPTYGARMRQLVTVREDGSVVMVRSPGVGALTEAQRARFASVYRVIYLVVMVTAFLTAVYTFRAFYLTFYGPLRIPHEAGSHAQESPPVMWWPLVALAVGAGVAGIAFDRTYFSAPVHLFAEFIQETPSLAGVLSATKKPYAFHLFVAGVSTVVALSGWLAATYLFLGDRREAAWLRSFLDFEAAARWLDVEAVSRWKNLPWVAATQRISVQLGLGRVTAALGQIVLLIVLVLATPVLLGQYVSPYKLSRGKFYCDELYHLVIVAPLKYLAVACYTVDRWLVDGTVNAVGRIPPLVGSLMRSMQMGLVQFYALSMLLGAIVLLAAKWLVSS